MENTRKGTMRNAALGRNRNTTPSNPADKVEKKTATVTGGTTFEIRATCVGCVQRCFITKDNVCIPAQNISGYSWKYCIGTNRNMSSVGTVLKVQCQPALVLQQQTRSKQKAA